MRLGGWTSIWSACEIGDTDSDVLADAVAGCGTVLIEQEASRHKRKGRATGSGDA
jgi:hypothetical protein